MKWSAQQLQCMEALGVPVYAFKPPVALSRDEPKVAPAATQAQVPSQQAPKVVSLPEPGNARPATPAATTPATKETTTSEPAVTSAEKYYYRVGPWVLELSNMLPVEHWPWLRDLAAYCNTLPSQVSSVDDALNIDAFAKATLTSEQKKQLWQTLKAKLSS